MSWDQRWIDMVGLVAGWSKDRSTKTGCVIVDSRNVLVSIGWNGFPRGVTDGVEERHERPAKYQWTEHAERNAIYNAAAVGQSLLGCRLYCKWYPCADCARAIISTGISELHCGEPTDHPKFQEEFPVTRQMLHEAGVNVVTHKALNK